MYLVLQNNQVQTKCRADGPQIIWLMFLEDGGMGVQYEWN
jgi:hypothetical protein